MTAIPATPMMLSNGLMDNASRKGPMHRQNKCYVLSSALGLSRPGAKPPAGLVDQATLDSLGLSEGDSFAYWFDFGDDWWHQVNVESVEQKTPTGQYPRVTKKVGKSPPQYANMDEDE